MDRELKKNPYHVTPAQSLKPEGVSSIMSMNSNNTEEVQDLATSAWSIMTAMRAEDMHCMLSSKTTVEVANKKTPRGFKTILPRTKNDPMGSGPVSGRTYFLPCSCLESLQGNEKAKFLRDLKKEPLCPCVTPCAFEKVFRYYNLCPDNTGNLRSMGINTNSTLQPLGFWRARASTGQRRILTTNLGLGSIKDSIKRVNLRLPENLRLTKPTAHGLGRRTHITNAVNCGVDPTVVSITSKHKDPLTLKRYIDPDNSSFCRSSLAISNSINSLESSNNLGGMRICSSQTMILNLFS
jgi:hypothetical protein